MLHLSISALLYKKPIALFTHVNPQIKREKLCFDKTIIL